MKRIIWGIIRRRWWLYASAPVLSAAFGVLIPWLEAHDALRGMATGPKDPELIRDIVAGAPFIPVLLAAATGFAAVGDLVGAAGVMNQLPVSARRIGLSYWLMAAVLPPVMTGLVLGDGAALWGHFGPPGAPGGEAVMEAVLSSCLSTGFFFFAWALHAGVLTSAGNRTSRVLPGLSRVFPQTASVLPTTFRILGSVALILVSLGSPVILPVWLHSSQTHPGRLTGLALLGVAVTVAGGWRAEGMVLVWSRKRFREVDLGPEQQEPKANPATASSQRSNIATNIITSVLTIVVLLGLSRWIFGFPRGRQEFVLGALTCFALALKDALACYLRPQKYSDYLHPARLVKYWARDRSVELKSEDLPADTEAISKRSFAARLRGYFADQRELPLDLIGLGLVLAPLAAISVLPAVWWQIVLLIVVGHMAEPEDLFIGKRPEKRPEAGVKETCSIGRTPTGKPLPAPGRLGAFQILTDSLSAVTVVMVCLIALVGIGARVQLIFGVPKTASGPVVIPNLFRLGLLVCAVVPSMRHAGSVRLLRSLPVSGRKLAATLFFQPLMNIAAFLVFSGVAWSLGITGGMTPPSPAVLLYLAGAGSFLNSLGLRLGWNPQLMLFAFLLAANPYSFLQMVPPIFLWITGVLLLAGSYGLLRGSINSSGMYRHREA